MAEPRTFNAFFSYAHYDVDTDSALIPAFTTQLESRVNSKLANARFEIWRDVECLRTGQFWNEKIEVQLRAADILIVLLTPRWIESDFCRKEYAIFEEVEITREVGEYVIPLLARSIDRQEKHFSREQKIIYERISARQYQNADAVEFIKLCEADQIKLIDKIADDVEGMIERLRVLPPPSANTSGRPMVRPRRIKEFDSKAQNYERVDFFTEGEVVLDRPRNNGSRDVLAYVEFIERLYVQGQRGRIEFGVRRAYLTIKDDGSGELSKVDELRNGPDCKTRYYTTLQNAPDAITVCIDPPEGKTSLAELPLPPANGENHLSKVAMAKGKIGSEGIKAELLISLDAEGLYLSDGRAISPRTETSVRAIMKVASAKLSRNAGQIVDADGLLRRTLQVRERS